VLAPVTPDIYYPLLSRLQQDGIKSIEEKA